MLMDIFIYSSGQGAWQERSFYDDWYVANYLFHISLEVAMYVGLEGSPRYLMRLPPAVIQDLFGSIFYSGL